MPARPRSSGRRRSVSPSPAKPAPPRPRTSAKRGLVTQPTAKTAADAAGDDEAFRRQVKLYVACVSTLALTLGVLVRFRPPSPPGGVCDRLSVSMLLPKEIGGGLSTQSVLAFWSCTKAYQTANWWFVLALFEVTYIGLKMLALPATFTLCILAGALFPLPYCQLVTGVAEAVGSSLCYLLSQTLFSLVVKRVFASKLALLRERAAQEQQYMLSFNFFLRLTPFMPNWLINLACPHVGVPLRPFFIGSLFGTQLSLLFLALSGETLKTAGEKGFDLDNVQQNVKRMGLLMGVLQCVPILFVYVQKRRAAATGAAPKKAKKA